MNQKIKKQWVSALRSGKYKQGKRKLCYGNQNGTKYCCLGVVSDLAVKNGICSRRTAFSGNSCLSKSVQNWLEVDSRDPVIHGKSLSELNDCGKYSFKEIAKLIEDNL